MSKKRSKKKMSYFSGTLSLLNKQQKKKKNQKTKTPLQLKSSEMREQAVLRRQNKVESSLNEDANEQCYMLVFLTHL